MKIISKRKLISILLCLVLCLSCFMMQTVFAMQDSFASEGDILPDGSVVWNGHKYQIVYKQKYWKDAEKYCESLGGHLVTITSSDEQTVLVNYLMSQDAEGKFMIGLYSETGNMRNVSSWVTGEPVIYTNWGYGQPDGGQSVAILSTIEFGGNGWHIYPYQWDDDAESIYAFICEWDDISQGIVTENTDVNPVQETSEYDPNENFDKWLFPELYEEDTKSETEENKTQTSTNNQTDSVQTESQTETQQPAFDRHATDMGHSMNSRPRVMNASNVEEFIHALSGESYDQSLLDVSQSGNPTVSTKPMTVYQEVGINYSVFQMLDFHGAEAESLMLPTNVNVTMDGKNISIYLPMIAGQKYDCAAYGYETASYWPEYVNFRDELALHGTIDYTGSSYEGAGYLYDMELKRPFYYFVGTIDSAEGILEDGFSSSFKETTGLGSQEIHSMSHIGSYQRDGENYCFSKFYLYYFPDDDFYELCIELYGDYSVIRDYPWDEENPHETLNYGGKEPYGIALVSSINPDGFRTGDYRWDWMEWY